MNNVLNITSAMDTPNGFLRGHLVLKACTERIKKKEKNVFDERNKETKPQQILREKRK